MAYLRKIGKGKTWYAQFKNSQRQSRTYSTRLKDVGSPIERADIKRRAQRIADGMERIVLGELLTEAALRELTFKLFEEVNNERIFRPSIADFYNKYLAKFEAMAKLDKRSSGTLRTYTSVVKEFLQILGDSRSIAPFDTLVKADFENYVAERLKVVDESTLYRNLKVLRAPLNTAVQDGILKANPALGVKVEKNNGVERLVFTLEEMDRLMAVCRDPKAKISGDGSEMEGLICIGYYTAMRLADAVTLKWENVDLLAKTIRFLPQKSRGKPAKKGGVTIPLTPPLEAVLRNLPSAGTGQRFLFPSHLPTSWEEGQKIDVSYLSKRFNRVVDLAGIDPCIIESEHGRETRTKVFHSLRHTCNSLLANMGVSQEIRMLITGHEDEKVNLKYTHIELETMRAALEKMPQIQIG